MNRSEAIRTIKAAARARSLSFSDVAVAKIADRGETMQSVSAAVAAARSFTAQNRQTYRVTGDDLTVIVTIGDGGTCHVKTAF